MAEPTGDSAPIVPSTDPIPDHTPATCTADGLSPAHASSAGFLFLFDPPPWFSSPPETPPVVPSNDPVILNTSVPPRIASAIINKMEHGLCDQHLIDSYGFVDNPENPTHPVHRPPINLSEFRTFASRIRQSLRKLVDGCNSLRDVKLLCDPKTWTPRVQLCWRLADAIHDDSTQLPQPPNATTEARSFDEASQAISSLIRWADQCLLVGGSSAIDAPAEMAAIPTEPTRPVTTSGPQSATHDAPKQENELAAQGAERNVPIEITPAKGLTKIAQAIALKRAHPELTDKEVAKSVECNPSTLCKSLNYKAARDAVAAEQAMKLNRSRRRRGNDMDTYSDDPDE